MQWHFNPYLIHPPLSPPCLYILLKRDQLPRFQVYSNNTVIAGLLDISWIPNYPSCVRACVSTFKHIVWPHLLLERSIQCLHFYIRFLIYMTLNLAGQWCTMIIINVWDCWCFFSPVKCHSKLPQQFKMQGLPLSSPVLWWLGLSPCEHSQERRWGSQKTKQTPILWLVSAWKANDPFCLLGCLFLQLNRNRYKIMGIC